MERRWGSWRERGGDFFFSQVDVFFRFCDNLVTSYDELSVLMIILFFINRRYFVTLHEVSCTQATTTYDQQLALSDQNFCVKFFSYIAITFCFYSFSLSVFFSYVYTFQAVSTFWISIDGYNFQHWVIYQRCVNTWHITYQKWSKLIVKYLSWVMTSFENFFTNYCHYLKVLNVQLIWHFFNSNSFNFSSLTCDLLLVKIMFADGKCLPTSFLNLWTISIEREHNL